MGYRMTIKDDYYGMNCDSAFKKPSQHKAHKSCEEKQFG